MEIKLYRVHPEISKEKLKVINISTKGKLATFFEGIDIEEVKMGEMPPCPETREFSCEYDNRYKKNFGNLKLNYRFNFYHMHEDDCGFLGGLEGFASLNFFQRLKIEWLFQRSWLQKEGNIKWLISIPISMITALITTYLINCWHIFK